MHTDQPLWELADDYLAALQVYLEAGEGADDFLRTALDDIGGDIKEKVENISKYILHLEVQAQNHKAQATGQTNRAKAKAAEAEKLRAYLTAELGILPKSQRSFNDLTIPVRWHDGSKSIDESLIDRGLADEVFWEEQPSKLMKKSVWSAIKNAGGVIPAGFEQAIVKGKPGVTIG